MNYSPFVPLMSIFVYYTLTSDCDFPACFQNVMGYQCTFGVLQAGSYVVAQTRRK